jgi:hypothetical protein
MSLTDTHTGSLTPAAASRCDDCPMTTWTRQRTTPRWVLSFLAAIVAVLAIIGLAATTPSASAAGVAGTRVGASDVPATVAVGPPERIGAGQRLREAAPRVVVVVATGVAAKAAGEGADDWPIISGIVRDAGKSKGNFGLGEGTLSQANRAGESWVGEGAHWSSGGKALISRDGLRQWRPPTYKPNWDNYQSNFQWRWEPSGEWQGNGHLTVDMP